MSAQVPVLGGESGGSGWGGDLSGFICQADTAAELWPRVMAEPEAGPFTDRDGRRAVATTVEAGSFARQRRWQSCGRTVAAGRDGGGEVVGHWRRGSVLSWGGIDDRGGAAGRVVRAPVPG